MALRLPTLNPNPDILSVSGAAEGRAARTGGGRSGGCSAGDRGRRF